VHREQGSGHDAIDKLFLQNTSFLVKYKPILKVTEYKQRTVTESDWSCQDLGLGTPQIERDLLSTQWVWLARLVLGCQQSYF